MTFGDIIWFLLIGCMLVGYLLVLFMVVTDLFRNKRRSAGWTIAAWMLALIALPLVAMLAYAIVHGKDLGRHDVVHSPTDEIIRAQELLRSGAIAQAEYDALKIRVLG